jgi:hypothetical protein
MLLALSSIRAQSGITPSEVIELLLHVTENLAVEKAKVASNSERSDDHQPSDLHYDESHICCVLLLALSRIRVSISTNAGDALVVIRRIIAICDYYLERDVILSVAATTQSHMSGKIQTSAGGILTASALQCVCQMECQMHPVEVSTTSESFHISASTSFNYIPYLDPSKYSPLVRSAACECLVQLIVISLADQSQKQGANIISPGPHSLINFCLAVIKNDPNVTVRRNVANALVRVLQDVTPLSMIYCACAVGNNRNALGWNDVSAFSCLNSHSALHFGSFEKSSNNNTTNNNTKKKSGGEVREYFHSGTSFSIVEAVRIDLSNETKTSLIDLFETICSHASAATDQVTTINKP